jgi:hypothetical protein
MNESLKNWEGGGWVRVDFARQLEIERDEARKELSLKQQTLTIAEGTLSDLRKKLNEWQTLCLWGGTPEHIHDFIKGQQTRIHQAQEIEKTCEKLEHSRDEWAAMCGRYKQERDEAQKELSLIHRWIERNHADGVIDSLTYLQNLERVTDSWYDRFDGIERERDEAREALASREVVLAQQKVITDLILERDQARAVLQEIEAARWHTACELRRIATRALGNLTIPTK